MTQTTLDDMLIQVRYHLEQDDLAGAVALIESLRSPDQADLFAELDQASQTALLPQLETADSADILEEMEDYEAARLLDGLPMSDQARIVDEMEPDETADLLAELDEAQVKDILSRIDQEEVARIVARYDLLALPVVDESGLLVGVITVDDVIDVLVDEATEDIQRLAATEPLDKPYLETPALTVFRKRIGWLLLLFLTETLTGTVLRHFEGELAAVVSLAFFIPLLIGTGGNAGSQTTSTIIRALALGEMDKVNALKPLWHELRVGVLLGLGMSIFAYFRALLWGTGSGVALTVGVAIFVIVLWANVLGSVLPLLAYKFKVDPTVVSGPAMTTLVDATGLFIYFAVAGIVLNL